MRTIYGFVYTLRPYERGIQETLGKYNGFVMPGLGFQIPLVHITRVRDVREHTMDIHPQAVITKDNVEIMVDGIMWVRPTIDEEAIKRTFYNIDDWQRAIVQLAMTNLRQEFGDLTLDESLVARETIATNLQRVLNTYAVEWGLTVSKVEIRLIDPPDDIKKAMHKQKTAEQERRSMRLLATGEFEAAEQQKLAIIQRAEGEREAVIQVAQGKAEAIRLVNEAAEKYFVGNAQELKKLEMIENSLRENSKIVITEHGISPTLLLGSLPVSTDGEKVNKILKSIHN
ncbi:MAG: SPFH/Band 7/PHB domain protein [Anaerolineales bacterium]|jgi:regulator of protease activity HflC (stomatin/prohibitin superfamily)|uniref:SPFH domain-containing protein n=1 Tax=Candidatus Villigracilis vicinus TaxID=3140679 RepID=UPI0031376232|nr:SPFH/Band 7/PHB domain protein [Anaerolineales bacterium]MBK7450639.1 SPFH/Band 7/PHB domain protein [Anaerolineales bacterium]MBK9782202.1 SPFH/Band 7/PHB domain protein [Anaerolineales bacterium]